MPRDISDHNRDTLKRIEAMGYRVGIGEGDGRWIATAKRDSDGQFHVSKAGSEDEAVMTLAELVASSG